MAHLTRSSVSAIFVLLLLRQRRINIAKLKALSLGGCVSVAVTVSLSARRKETRVENAKVSVVNAFATHLVSNQFHTIVFFITTDLPVTSLV
ncbi:hypothetical protein GQ457_01G024150 [Hibiscus cannabinus]